MTPLGGPEGGGGTSSRAAAHPSTGAGGIGADPGRRKTKEGIGMEYRISDDDNDNDSNKK